MSIEIADAIQRLRTERAAAIDRLAPLGAEVERLQNIVGHAIALLETKHVEEALKVLRLESEPNEQLSAEGKAGPAGDASDSGRVAHRHTNAGETPAPRFHTTEDDFQHFLSYEQLRSQPPAELQRLRKAYYAGADVGAPDEATQRRFAQLIHPMEPESAEKSNSPQAPIAHVHVFAGRIAGGYLYAPSLPDGEHDVYCEPKP